jgi:site-specific DNA-methyltransferase (adenine-specific)
MGISPYYEGHGITLYKGDAITVLQSLREASVDALITDPPYSSGGMYRGDRAGAPAAKYVQHGVREIRPTFSGDNRDQRSWSSWCTLWLNECRRVVKPAGYALMFSDWRQLPTATDAFQWGGLIWRGIVAWDKTEAARAPHTGYFRHQCEYIVWGTNGPAKSADGLGPWPGAFRVPVKQSDKHHMTGKPTLLMERLVACEAPGKTVLDPFAGSGSTLVGALRTGRMAIGIEAEESYCAIAAARIQREAELLQPDLRKAA